MSDLLDKIDQNLLKLEHRVIAEFVRLQESDDPTGFGQLGEKTKVQMREYLNKLSDTLEHSGDTQNLELTTDYHEMLRSRLFVANRLLDLKIPTKFLRYLTKPVLSPAQISENLSEDANPVKAKQSGFTSRESRHSGFLEFFRSRFSSDKGDKSKITAKSASLDQQKEIYKDQGPYAAAQQMAMLASVVIERQVTQAQQVAAREKLGRASFGGVDLGHRQLKARDIARSPEEIRKKLEARKEQVQSVDKASFAAADTSHDLREDVARLQAEKQQRLKKTTEATAQPNRGKAKFGSRDVSDQFKK